MSFIGNILASNAYFKHARGNEAEARPLYEKAIKHKTTNTRNLIAYAVMLLRSGDFDKAVEVLRYADKLPVKKEADRRQIRVHYAIAQWKLGKTQNSVELLEELHRKGPTGTVYGTLGYLYIAMKDLDKALAYNTEAFEYDDEDYVILDNMGQTYYFLGEKDKAKPLFEKALELRPTLVDSLYYLASIHFESGSLEEAYELMEKAQSNTISTLSTITRESVDELMEKIKAARSETNTIKDSEEQKND